MSGVAANGGDGAAPTADARAIFETTNVRAPDDGPRWRTGHRPAGSRRQHRLNTLTAWILVFVALASPIPMASNRPIFWMLWAAIIALVAGWNFFAMAHNGWRWRYSGAENPVLAAGVLLFFGFLLVQVLPLGGIVGGFDFRFPGDVSLHSSTLSLTPRASQLALLRLASYGLFFFLMLQVSRNRHRARLIAWVVFTGVVVHAVWALLSLHEFKDTFFWGAKKYYLGAATGTFINRNSFATFLGFGMVLGIALLMRKAPGGARPGLGLARIAQSEGIQRFILYFLVALVFATLLDTQSRMGLFSTAFGAVFALVVGGMKRNGIPWRTLAVVAGAVVLASLVIGTLYGRDLIERLVFIEKAAETRGALYSQVIEMIRARPFLGYGTDGFEQVFPLFRGPPLNVDLFWDRAHSTYLTLWSEMGVIFGSLPLVICVAIFWRLARHVASARHDYSLAIAAMATMIVGGIHSLVDFSLEMQANVFLFLTIVALGVPNRRGHLRARIEPGAD